MATRSTCLSEPAPWTPRTATIQGNECRLAVNLPNSTRNTCTNNSSNDARTRTRYRSPGWILAGRLRVLLEQGMHSSNGSIRQIRDRL